MKKFKNPGVSILYLFYRLIHPILDPLRLYTGITGYFWFIRDLISYKSLDPGANIPLGDLFPITDEKLPVHPFDAHYFHQVIWAFGHILDSKPDKHIDVASKYEFSGYVSTVTKSVFVDIRPMNIKLPNLFSQKGSILDLPFTSKSLQSVSCLHVIEHIGLGRYGDTIDPLGSVKACRELARVLKKGGKLYITVPIGIERVCFNAHRVFDPVSFVKNFPDLTLQEFSCVDDNGVLHRNVKPEMFRHMYYGCGFYLLKRD